MAGPSSPESSASLATACPSCSTVFRVVQDQLKVSQGWVRCGRCHEVFNALEALFDLDVRRDGDPPAPRTSAGLPPPGSLTPPAPSAPAPAVAPVPTPPPPAPVPARFPSAPVHGGWDESSPAALPDTRKGAISAAAALRDRLAARTGAAAPPPTSRPRGGGLFVEEPVVDEAELDTRFEPKFFDADSAPGGHRPPVSGAPAVQAQVQPSSPGAPAAAPAPMPVPAPAPATTPVTVDIPTGSESDLRREPWLDAPPPPPLASPAVPPSVARPAREKRHQARAASAGSDNGGEWTQPWNETIVDPSVLPAREAVLHDTAQAASSTSAAMPTSPGADEHAAVDGGDDGRGVRLPAPDPMQVGFDAAHAGQPAPASGALDTQVLAPGGPMTQPGFLREAERKARWQRPWVRVLLCLVCLLLAAAVVLQLGVRNRDRYAARWPVARPVLVEICNWLDCTLQPPRMLDALVVETSSLTRPPGIDGLRLQLVLRNRVEHEVAAPHVELTLTDAAGAISARRVFNPGEFGITRAVLPGQQDTNWSLVFSTSARNIAGYTVSVFYP